MKKLALSLVVGAALAFTPLSSFALTAMSADTMKDATGQAGVSIVVDDVTLYQTVGESMYIDTDGIDGLVTDTAGITISEKATFTTIRALLDYSDRGGFLKTAFATDAADTTGYKKILNGTMGNRFNDDYNNETPTDLTPDGINDYTDADGNAILGHIEIAAISIDVASRAPICTKLDTNGDGSDVAAVIIGLPTIEICKTGDTQQIGITACDSKGDYTAPSKTFIQIEKSDSVLTVMGGSLEIAAH